MMKIKILTVLLSVVSANTIVSADTVTLSEAERMVDSGKAFIVKLPSSAILAQIKEDEINVSKTLELKRLKMLEINVSKPLDLNTTKWAENNISKSENISNKPKSISTKIIKEPIKFKEGISIAMPTTLSSLLTKLAILNNENYFCEDNLNIPPSRVKITDIVHLDHYLKQVSSFGITVIKDSNDPTIPKVLKVIRIEMEEIKK